MLKCLQSVSRLGSSHQIGIFIVYVYGRIAMLGLRLKTLIVHFTSTGSDVRSITGFDVWCYLGHLNADRSSREHRTDGTSNGHSSTFILIGHHMLILVILEVSLHDLSLTKPTR
jgi:hypothetical protein